MSESNQIWLPNKQLARLDFLVGEAEGRETLFPPGGKPIVFASHATGTREHCMRFVRLELYSDIPGLGIESSIALVTFSVNLGKYKLWHFSSAHEDPLCMVGEFIDQSLTMVSTPTEGLWGTQQTRCTWTPFEHGYDLCSELWEPDGYVQYRTVSYGLLDQLRNESSA